MHKAGERKVEKFVPYCKGTPGEAHRGAVVALIAVVDGNMHPESVQCWGGDLDVAADLLPPEIGPTPQDLPCQRPVVHRGQHAAIVQIRMNVFRLALS